jgi:hypothetical protein
MTQYLSGLCGQTPRWDPSGPGFMGFINRQVDATARLIDLERREGPRH